MSNLSKKTFVLGIDIGSTTAKIVLLNDDKAIIHSEYVRHNTKVAETLHNLLVTIAEKFGDIAIKPVFSGSAAMGIAERTETPFTQEIIATNIASNALYPGIKSLIDIGGEDAKLVIFSDSNKPDIRMNGNCAGGTGAYIDQMASLLNKPVSELNDLAWKSTKTYPIASRCGVFAKTDVQNLVSRKISVEDIAASIFDAVAHQIVNSLARGCTIEPKLLFCGGPLTYISYLRKSFADLLQIDKDQIIVPERAELFIALGTAMSVLPEQLPISISEFMQKLESNKSKRTGENTLDPLFANKKELDHWELNQQIIAVPERDVADGEVCFLGIDSGSTTTKIIITGSDNTIVYKFYKNSNGHPLETVVEGLTIFAQKLKDDSKTITIQKSAVTGYGEDLIHSALGMDYGIVETVAHFLAAKHIEPEVSFILDIGGQDIKAINVQNDTITNIEINEACSSGCGTFIEGFAQTLGYSPRDFAHIATQSKAPYDLGSRCTVFMNSKVKQALRDGSTVEDLSAGLAYSVIKNCLNKVLKIKNYSTIGDNIVVQGGTFRNKAVFRSLELLSGKKIVVSDKPEMMGAYGVALYAASKAKTDKDRQSGFVGFDNLEAIKQYTTKISMCKGCTNNCHITVYTFPNGRVCYSGNKCEKTFTNNQISQEKGQNIFEYKKRLLFTTNQTSQTGKPTIGIPRILNMYENFPFWNALFTNCGFQVVLSDESSNQIYKKGNGSIMSDNICFPAKLSHGHIVNLIEKKVDRIFSPLVVYEQKQFESTSNSYNCPIVTGYSEVLKSTSTLLDAAGIPFDSPGVNFADVRLLRKACVHYLSSLGVKKQNITKAFILAQNAQQEFKEAVQQQNKAILDHAITNNQAVVLVASHPYHSDHLIHQRVSHVLADLGVSVINEEIATEAGHEGFDSYFSVAQWEYPNRILHAAQWVTRQKQNIGLIQLNSFGCGPDSFISDEIKDLAKRFGTSYALIRIDEVSSPGSIKLRLRSLVESMKLKTAQQPDSATISTPSKNMPIYTSDDTKKTILVPWFSDFVSPFIPALGKLLGYTVENIPASDQQCVDLGLEYSNNEVCYPCTLIVGDIIKALKSGNYDLNNIVIGMTQTGGQCRATNYIAIIKRAMANAGFGNIPVVAISSAEGVHNLQPGFNPRWSKILQPAFFSILFIDSISRLYYATVCRESNKGDSLRLREQYLTKATELLGANAHGELFQLVKKAIQDFNAIPVTGDEVQTVGIVGEIYIKYNSFGQYGITDWLSQNNVEVIVPPLVEFFTQSFINSEAYSDNNITKPEIFTVIKRFSEWLTEHYIKKYETELKNFRFYRPAHSIREEAKLASNILSLANQYGEGWLIPAEIASFSKHGVNNVICIQPFGCIANHIIGKGLEKKIKQQYPQINLLFLDLDYDTSKVNLLNRMHFLLQNQ